MDTFAIVRALTRVAGAALTLIGADREGTAWVTARVGSLLAAHAATLFTEGELGFLSWEAAATLEVIDADTACVVWTTDRKVRLEVATAVPFNVAGLTATGDALAPSI